MAKLGTNFRASEHDTDQQNDFELLPNGTFQLEVTASDVKEEAGNITLALTYDVIEPAEYKGRKIFAYLDLQHNEADKQARGQSDFAKLCRAVGIDDCDDSELLHFIAFTAKVKKGEAGVSKAGRPYKARNSISRWFYPDKGNIPAPEIDAVQPTPANDNRPAAQAASRPAAAAASGGGSRPWGKR